MKYVYIIVGGAAGSLLRFWMSEFVSTRVNAAFPAAIFIVNMLGALLIGFLFGLLSVNGKIDERLQFLLFIGFLGGFTTFSSFALENMRLLQDGYVLTALSYILLTNVLGIGLAYGAYLFAIQLK